MNYWSDGTVAHYCNFHKTMNGYGCGAVLFGTVFIIFSCNDFERPRRNYVCEIPTPEQQEKTFDIPVISIQTPATNEWAKIQTVRCPSRHFTHTFLACDAASACWSEDVITNDANSFSLHVCQAPLTSFPPPFECENGFERVPYSLVCDHRPDCFDASDENFCHFRPCAGDTPVQCGYSNECVRRTDLCDNQHDCVNWSDEADCTDVRYVNNVKTPPPPGEVRLVMRPGPDRSEALGFTVHPYVNVGKAESYPCPESHFQCEGNGYCLPVFLRCNDVLDCPGQEDEAGCDTYECPGFYRCRASRVCLHVTHVCDGIPHCPQGDDERLCHVTCPENCTCYGLALTCVGTFSLSLDPDVRYLTLSCSDMSGAVVPRVILSSLGGAQRTENDSWVREWVRGRQLASSRMLVHLGLAHCHLLHLQLPHLPNLRSLDVSYNGLSSVSLAQLRVMPELRELRLAGNPLSVLFSDTKPDDLQRPKLYVLDLSHVDLTSVNVSGVMNSRELRTLNLSHTGLRHLGSKGFHLLINLRVVDVRGCPLSSLPRGALRGLADLQAVYADIWTMCCPDTLPVDYNLQDCIAPSDVISTCQNLLGLGTVRVMLSISVVMAVTGNLALLAVPALCRRRDVSGSERARSGNGILTAHLAASGLVTGLSVCVPVTADRLQYGQVALRHHAWTQSPVCRLASFLFLLSTETAVFILCLLTAERLSCVLSLPDRWRLTKSGGAQVAGGCAWLLGLVLATLPLRWGDGWSQIGSTYRLSPGVCLPLPVATPSLHAHGYCLALLLGLNLLLLLLVMVGQSALCLARPSMVKVILDKKQALRDEKQVSRDEQQESRREVQYASPDAQQTSRNLQRGSPDVKQTSRDQQNSSRDVQQASRDADLARRLLPVSLLHFACCFFQALLALLSSHTSSLPDDVTVNLALVLLPMSAALTPLLYGQSILAERRRQVLQDRILKQLKARSFAKCLPR